jgi:hypothetical protein
VLSTASAVDLDEEIALDVDAFEMAPATPAVAAVPEPAPAPTPAPEPESPFSFTFVESFGDRWSEFDVPAVAKMAEDLGLAPHAPMDPFAVAAEPVADVAPVLAAEPAATVAAPVGPAAPVLDDEALSLIGDAARKASLDALVIEEFERGIPAKQRRKAKPKKVHAGATQVVPAPERPAAKTPGAKRPVQDEWGMFDPDQCGFAALEEDENGEPRPTGNTRTRVISY